MVFGLYGVRVSCLFWFMVFWVMGGQVIVVFGFGVNVSWRWMGNKYWAEF